MAINLIIIHLIYITFITLLLIYIYASNNNGSNEENNVGIVSKTNRKLSTSTSDDLIKPMKSNGDGKCPCISYNEKNKLVPQEKNLTDFLGPNVDQNTYGLNCLKHDLNSSKCSKICEPNALNYQECKKSGCELSWCYVNEKSCNLVYSQSHVYEDSQYSMATCGYVDGKKDLYDFSALKGKTLNVALNSNSGGWKGAYNPEGPFAMNNLWEGPALEFVQHAASQGGFILNYTKPPEWIYNYSREYFGSDSLFDYCVYAVGLGYLDLCIASYTFTTKRTETTPHFEMHSNNFYLFIKKEQEDVSPWQEFRDNLPKIFDPFTDFVWICILVFISILGLIMVFFEYDAPGSVYPKEIKSFSKSDNGKGEPVIEMRKIPIYKYFARSVYRSMLALGDQAYSQSVYTGEGQVILLAMSFFIMMIVSLYTANIAAMLTTSIQESRIKSLQDAMHQGYNFCAARKTVEIMKSIHNMDEKLFVPDPTDLGGDGKPGFSCSNCSARSRVFEFMRNKHNNPSLYCNAAIAYGEDLDFLQNSGEHCDVIKVGEPLASSPIGFPIGMKSFPGLSTIFNKLKIEGYVTKLYQKEKPESLCDLSGDEEPSYALTFSQLSGLWTVCLSLVLVAFLMKIFREIYDKKNPGRKRNLDPFNQWGEPSSREVIIDDHMHDVDKDELRQSVAPLANKEIYNKEVQVRRTNSTNSAFNGLRRRDEKEVQSRNDILNKFSLERF